MTITVTDLVAGPFVGTGAAQVAPFAFKAFTETEVEVYTVDAEGVETVISPLDYTVTLNEDVDGTRLEGGSVTITTTADEFYVRAAPDLTQEQVWSDTGSRLKNLNEALDRAHLALLRLRYDLDRGIADFEADVLIVEAASAAAIAAADVATGVRDAIEGEIDIASGLYLANHILALARSTQSKLRESPLSPNDYSGATDAERIETATKAAMNGMGMAFIPPGGYNVDIAPLDISEEMRGKPVVIRGAGTGEPFVSAGLQEGTRLLGALPTVPTVDLKHRNPMSGSGSVDFGNFYIRGTKDTLIPILAVGGLQGINRIHDLGIVQLGLGNGVEMGNLTTSTFDNNHILGATWASSGSGFARTGTGFELRLDQDNGLGLLHKNTVRGWSLGYDFGGAAGLRPLGYRATLCESSVNVNGFLIGATCEGFYLDQPYIEATYGYGIKDQGEATLIAHPYIVLDFTTGIELRGVGGMVMGGYIGLKTTGAKGVIIGAETGGASIFGTQFIWGGGGAANLGHGIHIEAQADPVVNLFPDFRGNWTGVSDSARLLDHSYSAVHGGAASALGSGAVGWLMRRSQGNQPLPCLSRGAINLRVDGSVLGPAHISGSGTLTLSAASAQYLSLGAYGTAVNRFAAPNLPDKTCVLLISGGYARFDPSAYLKGIKVPLIFQPDELGAVWLQNEPGALGVMRIVAVQRSMAQTHTVATLPAAATAGVGYETFVTDATAPAWGAAVVGGGAVKTPVFSDGAAWIVG